jgi:hypothetical protein
LSGRLVFASGGDAGGLDSLEVEPFDRELSNRQEAIRLTRGPRLTHETEDTKVWTWDAGRVLPGRYLCTVTSTFSARAGAWSTNALLRVVLEVGPSGRRDVRLVVPELAEVELVLVERGTGNPIELEYLLWNPPLPEGIRTLCPGTALGTGDPGHYRLLASVGRITIDGHGGAYGRFIRSVLVRPGRNEHRIEIDRACGIRVTLRDGDEIHVLDGSGRYEVARVLETGSEEIVAWVYGSMRHSLLQVPGPGRYRVRFPAIDGFEPVPPAEFTAKEGQLEDLEIALRRRSQ